MNAFLTMMRAKRNPLKFAHAVFRLWLCALRQSAILRRQSRTARCRLQRLLQRRPTTSASTMWRRSPTADRRSERICGDGRIPQGHSRKGIDALPDSPGSAVLTNDAHALIDAVARKSDGGEIHTITARIHAELLRSYPVPLLPTRTPDLTLGANLYATQCAGCHGSAGGGDGPAASALQPHPTDFRDPAGAEQRSLYGLFNTITMVSRTPRCAPSRSWVTTNAGRWHSSFRAFTTCPQTRRPKKLGSRSVPGNHQRR